MPGWKLDPVAGKVEIEGWGKLDPASSVSVDRRAWWDGEVYCAGQAELLAASLGVVPLISVPGLGSPGATNFGKALEHLDSDRWDPAARELYLNVHRNFRRARLFIHGGEDPRAVVVPGLAGSPAGLEVAAFPPDVAEYGSAGLPAIYIACIVLAALGGMIVAYEAGSYASKSVPAGVALDQANLGKLVTAAVEQIAKTGKIDPGLAKTIALWKPPSSSWGGWVLAGGLVLGAGGLAVATYYGNKRGR